MNTDSHRHLPGYRPTPCQAKNSRGGPHPSSLRAAWRPLAALLIAIALQGMTACGGSGDGGSAPIVEPPPPPPPPPDDETNIFAKDRQTSGCRLMSE